MSEEGSDDKTEKPTGKKLGEARTQGMVGASADLSNVLSMTAAYIAFQHIIPSLWLGLISLTKASLNFGDYKDGNIESALIKGPLTPLLHISPLIFIVLLSAALTGALSTLLQTNFLWANKLFKPNFSHLNPISGIKKIFSLSNTFNLFKSIMKLAIIGPIGYYTFIDFFPSLLSLIDVPLDEHLTIGSIAMGNSFVKIITYLLILAILDLIWQKWRTAKKLKMSKQDIKDEAKASEGDESVKRKIISLGLTRARQRMMQDVPKADVIVTNPTHISVALKYDSKLGAAPIVLAKGKGHVALRIREIAKANNVPIVEKKPLARALFASVEVGKEIPYDLFKAVAEVLAYVYRLKGKRPNVSNTNNSTNNNGAR